MYIYLYVYILICIFMGVGIGGRGYRTPHSKIWGGLSMFCPPPSMKCVLINFIYIKSSILSLLIHIFAKECYQTYGGGAKYCLPPPPSLKYDNIHEKISERYFLSDKNEIIQLYKPELLNI